jgi:heptosyltransferase III
MQRVCHSQRRDLHTAQVCSSLWLSRREWPRYFIQPPTLITPLYYAHYFSKGLVGLFVNRLVIYRLGSLGDTIVALPFFNRIAELYPNHERIILTNVPISSNAAPILSVVGRRLVHRAIAYPIGTRCPAALWELRGRLRALDTIEIIYLMPSRGMFGVYRDVVFFRICGFGRPIGVPWTRDLDTCRISPQTGEEEPECERLARALVDLGPINLRDPALWDLHLDANETAAGLRAVEPFRGRPFVAINMGGKAPEKDWGVENWRRLLREMSIHNPECGLLVVGASEDSERVVVATDTWAGPVIDGCGRLAPRESAAAMKEAALFIGHDSGPLHLASAVGVRCVGLFGNFNRPRKWHPYIGENRTIHDLRGIRAITVGQVMSAVSELIG